MTRSYKGVLDDPERLEKVISEGNEDGEVIWMPYLCCI